MEMMPFHELAEAFPLMQGSEYAELVADIRERGLIEPIVTYEGKILDGRNRYRACMDAGVEPRFREWAGEHGSIVAFVWAQNGLRRNLNVGQRAVIALVFLPQLKAEAKRRHDELSGSRANPGQVVPISAQPAAHKSDAGKSVMAAARLVGVGKTAVQEAKHLHEAAATNATAAESFERVKAGTMKLQTAIRQLTKPPQRQQLASALTPTEQEHEGVITPLPPRWQMAHPAVMLVASLGGLRREMERQDSITDEVLTVWWEGVEWREWEAAKGDVLWFLKQCMPLLKYVSKQRNFTPPMVRKLKAIDAPPEPKAKAN